MQKQNVMLLNIDNNFAHENEFMVSLQKSGCSKKKRENVCTLYLYSFPSTNAIHFFTYALKMYTNIQRGKALYLPTKTMALFNIRKLRIDMPSDHSISHSPNTLPSDV